MPNEEQSTIKSQPVQETTASLIIHGVTDWCVIVCLSVLFYVGKLDAGHYLGMLSIIFVGKTKARSLGMPPGGVTALVALALPAITETMRHKST